MQAVRTLLLILGIAAMLAGLIFMGQGSGWFPYPRSSFMIDQRPWVYRGAILLAAGLVAVVLSRWMRG
jgi:hypothetical protein